MGNPRYASRKGPQYFEEKRIIDRISSKDLPAYIDDLLTRSVEADKKTLPFMDAKRARMEISFKIMDIDRKIKEITSNPTNRQFFGLFPKATPELVALRQEKWKLEEQLKKYQVNLIEQEIVELTAKDLSAALNLAEAKLNKIKAQKKKAEALKEKTALVAEYQGKSRRVAKNLKTRLPINPLCPYCGQKIGDKPHADHIWVKLNK